MNPCISAVLDHGWCTLQNAIKKLAFTDKQWIWLEISWLPFSPFGISHLLQQQIVFITVLHIQHGA